MLIGIPKEIKSGENRVGLLPPQVAALLGAGHRVAVQRGAGLGLGLADADYQDAGASLVDDAAALFATVDIVVKVKEILAPEYSLLSPGQIVFGFLHLNAQPDQAEAFRRAGASAIAYEFMRDGDGQRPILAPMSRIAGRMGVESGLRLSSKRDSDAVITILGSGVAAEAACAEAVRRGAQVIVLARNEMRRNALAAGLDPRPTTGGLEQDRLADALRRSDLVIGAAASAGKAVDKIVRREHLSYLSPGSVLVDIAIDQGGCFETSRPTSHDDPIYRVDGIIHYCVANMPGAVPQESAEALARAALPYIRRVADVGLEAAMAADCALESGVCIRRGDPVAGRI